MSNSLKAFMRKRTEEVVTVKGPETIKDENGKVVNLKVKRLSMKKVNEIYERYHTERIAKDEDGNIIVRNNRIVKDRINKEKENVDRLIIEALVEPNLKDPELMKFYGCDDVMDMPDAVFSSEEYFYVRDIVTMLSGTFDGEKSDIIVDEVKN